MASGAERLPIVSVTSASSSYRPSTHTLQSALLQSLLSGCHLFVCLLLTSWRLHLTHPHLTLSQSTAMLRRCPIPTTISLRLPPTPGEPCLLGWETRCWPLACCHPCTRRCQCTMPTQGSLWLAGGQSPQTWPWQATTTCTAQTRTWAWTDWRWEAMPCPTLSTLIMWDMPCHLDPTSIAQAPVPLLLPAATRDNASSKVMGMEEQGVALAEKGQVDRGNRGGGAALNQHPHPHPLTQGGAKNHVWSAWWQWRHCAGCCWCCPC